MSVLDACSKEIGLVSFLWYNKDMRTFWTDGSAQPNPGPGGFAVLEEISGKAILLASGGEPLTTNIYMEGLAIKTAIELANGEPCEIHTDSQFWIKTLTEWAPVWAANDWQKPIKNFDLVFELYNLYSDRNAAHLENPETPKNVTLIWVRGHAGNEFNELVDRYAKLAKGGKKSEL